MLIPAPVFAITYRDSVDVSFTFDPTLSISLSSSNISIDNLVPGNYGHSNTITINVSTNNVYGYTLTAKVGEDGGGTGTSASSDLVNTSSSTPFTSLSSNDRLTLANFNPNTWGYTTSSSINNDSTYSGLLYNTDTILNQTIGSRGNAIGGYAGTNTTNFTIGASASDNQLSGSYSNIITFTVISNTTPPPTLYELVAAMSKGKQTAADLQQPITTPTSSDPTTDTSNSGVFEYDSEVFGVASDASNNYKIYYYRGILDSAFVSTDSYGNIGSSGNGGYYPNYVRLGNTCWRIVRTTGSGGVKMIYNGLYSSGTVANSCANATTRARTVDTNFNSTSNISNRSIIAVGYTFNFNKKTEDAASQYGVLFGIDNDYSGNSANSTIKNYIENTWYIGTNGVSNYESILETGAGYCNDRSMYVGWDGAKINNSSNVVTPYTTLTSNVQVYTFGAYRRSAGISRSVPSLACPRIVADLYTMGSDGFSGNGQLTKAVALITADEATLAGSSGLSVYPYDANSYLRSGSSFWSFSPYVRRSDGLVFDFYVHINGRLDGAPVSNSYGVRPVVSLIHNVTPIAGSGTATDPWVIAAP